DSGVARRFVIPLFAHAPLRPALLASLIRSPDAGCIAALARELEASSASADSDPREFAALWLAARRAQESTVAQKLARSLAELGHPIPDPLLAADLRGADRAARSLAISLLPLDRESVYALRAP